MSVNRKYTSPWKSIMLFYKRWKLTQYIFILRFLCDLEDMFATSENGIYFEHIMCFKILIIEKQNGQNTYKKIYKYWNDCCCSVTKSCPTLCDFMNCSISDSLVLHYLPKFVLTHNVILLKTSKRNWTWDSTKHANDNENNNKTNSNNLKI